ncbi:hypothetical protein MCOR20_011670, partial [Pyricularia oryzae]
RAVALLSVAPPNAAIPTPFPNSGIACAFLLTTTAPVLNASGKIVLLNARTTTLATSLRPGLMAATRTAAHTTADRTTAVLSIAVLSMVVPSMAALNMVVVRSVLL